MERVERGGVTGMMKGLEHLSCEDGLRELRLFSLEKSQFTGISPVCINAQCGE